MKKIFYMACMSGLILLLTACNASTVCVGDMTAETPAVCVKTIHNNHFIGGLVGSPEIKGSTYVMGQESYKVKHYQSFVDGLLGSITMGIYTPTTTKIYLPQRPKNRPEVQP